MRAHERRAVVRPRRGNARVRARARVSTTVPFSNPFPKGTLERGGGARSTAAGESSARAKRRGARGSKVRLLARDRVRRTRVCARVGARAPATSPSSFFKHDPPPPTIFQVTDVSVSFWGGAFIAASDGALTAWAESVACAPSPLAVPRPRVATVTSSWRRHPSSLRAAPSLDVRELVVLVLVVPRRYS